jgi:sodium-dependent dicarboxylate transporter 2/3/5
MGFLDRPFSILRYETSAKEIGIFVIGPLLWLACILAEPLLGGTITNRGGLGTILWASWYWGTGAMPMGYTLFVPIFGFAFLPGMEWAEIMKSLMHPALGMLLGPALVVCMWTRWGLTRRIALSLLTYVGTSVRKQAVMWVVMATVLSFFAANVVIAIALIPIGVEMLNEVGYDTVDKKRRNLSATLIVIAIAAGASLGGFMTPMAGGQAVITWAAMGNALGAEVSMWSHFSRMVVPVFLSMLPVIALFAWVFPVDEKEFEGSEEYFRNELAKMGSITKAEFWSFAALALAILLPFTKPLWVAYVPIDLTPAMIFSLLVGLLLIVPVPRDYPSYGIAHAHEDERFLSKKAINLFPVHAFMLWPIAMSIAVLVESSGASGLMGNFLGEYWNMPAWAGVGLLVLFCLILAQPASDTGAAGMLAGTIALATTQAGANPVPWLFIMGFTVNFCFVIPAATGTLAVPVAFGGKSHPRLPLYGAALAIVCGIVSWLWWTAVIHFDWTFWQTVTTVGA